MGKGSREAYPPNLGGKEISPPRHKVTKGLISGAYPELISMYKISIPLS
jgi:hypothetical protein